MGSEFQRIAREQATSFGARIENARVESVAQGTAGFEATLEGGEQVQARFLDLVRGQISEARSSAQACRRGLRRHHGKHQRQDLARRRLRRGTIGASHRSQPSSAPGMAPLLRFDILSLVKGEPVQDWDSPPEAK